MISLFSAVDFKKPDEAGRTISRWAKSKTKGGLKLNDIQFSPATKIALTSAIYFKGKFVYTFQEAKNGLFQAPSGPLQTKMMTMKRKFHWGKIGNFAEWVAIPYESSDMLVIILPKNGANVDNVMSSMSAVDLGNIIRDMDSDTAKANVNLTLPKFKFESTTNLVEPLQRVSFLIPKP